jgi:HD-GYP domain-containing protein (c-di-GMP phosphodiesterase class II)
MKLLRLCAHHLKVGQALPWNVRNEPGHLLLGKGILLADQAQIDNLLERGVYVDQEEYEEALRAEAEADKARKNPFSLWADILKRTGHLLRNHKNNPAFASDMAMLSSQVQGAMQEDIDAGTFEMVNGDPTGYSVTHSLQTAFVASLAAERFGWSENERATLVRAALTMNIAMLDTQNLLTKQTTPLTAQQKHEIASHASRGRELLEKAHVSCGDWLSTVENHHVTIDGRGLPEGRGDLSQIACMIHYADVYLAKLSPRASRPAIAANVAARELFLNGGGASNPFVSAIIKQMGIFPPGSFVKLANGDTAVVVRPGETANTPQVHSLITSDGWVFPETKLRDTARPEFKIVSAVPRSNVLIRLDKQKLFGYTAA